MICTIAKDCCSVGRRRFYEFLQTPSVRCCSHPGAPPYGLGLGAPGDRTEQIPPTCGIATYMGSRRPNPGSSCVHDMWGDPKPRPIRPVLTRWFGRGPGVFWQNVLQYRVQNQIDMISISFVWCLGFTHHTRCLQCPRRQNIGGSSQVLDRWPHNQPQACRNR